MGLDGALRSGSKRRARLRVGHVRSISSSKVKRGYIWLLWNTMAISQESGAICLRSSSEWCFYALVPYLCSYNYSFAGIAPQSADASHTLHLRTRLL